MSRDYKSTVFLPKTDFPMRGGLPKREPELLARWDELGLFERLRADSKGREKFILHDGPPYANGHLHIGHALNKILKDVINRSQQMLGKDANYVPGWDCHGLPIEWKIEEQYRAKGKDKDEVPILEFRRECREFAEKWVAIQSEEFQRLGVVGNWDDPYLTMALEAEARIAAELMKFAENGRLFQGSKPVMWSVVEKTALAEAEVEYHDHTSHTIWVKFPVIAGGHPDALSGADVVIWTTTPWTIPANRAVVFSHGIDYGLYEVTAAPDDNWAKAGRQARHGRRAGRLGHGSGPGRGLRTNDGGRSERNRALRPPLPRYRGRPGLLGLRRADAAGRLRDRRSGHRLRAHRARPRRRRLCDVREQPRGASPGVGLTEVPHTVGEAGEYYDHVPLLAGKCVYTPTRARRATPTRR